MSFIDDAKDDFCYDRLNIGQCLRAMGWRLQTTKGLPVTSKLVLKNRFGNIIRLTPQRIIEWVGRRRKVKGRT